jgi:hypothetical protein
MTIRRFVVPVTVDDSGDAEFYSPHIRGKIISIRYVKSDFADGVDFTITGEISGQGIWSEEDVNASATRYPRAATHSTAGAAALYASGGTAVNDRIALDERIKIVVADGGDTKSGAFHITVDG